MFSWGWVTHSVSNYFNQFKSSMERCNMIIWNVFQNKNLITRLIFFIIFTLLQTSLLAEPNTKLISIINPDSNYATNKNIINIKIFFNTNIISNKNRGGGNIKLIKLTINGVPTSSQKNSANKKSGYLIFPINISKYTDEKLAIQAIGYQGNEKDKHSYESDIIYVLVDRTPPLFNTLSPNNGLVTKDLLVDIAAEFSDNFSGIDKTKTRLYIDEAVVKQNGDSPVKYVPVSDWKAGKHSWYLLITDKAGNSTKSPLSNFSLDLSGGAVKTIKASKGGTIKLPDKVTIQIPPNALKTDTRISVDVTKKLIDPGKATKESGGIDLPNTTYEFGPHGTTFSEKVTLQVNYDPTPLNKISEKLGKNAPREEDLKVLQYDHHENKYVPVGGIVNLEDKTVTASINHFSHYSVGITWSDWWKFSYANGDEFGYCSFTWGKLFPTLTYASLVFHDDCTRHDLCYKYGYASYKKCSVDCSADFCSDIKKRCDDKSWLGWLYGDKEMCLLSANSLCVPLIAAETTGIIGPSPKPGGVTHYSEQCCADYDHDRYNRPPTEMIDKTQCKNDQSDASIWCSVMKDPNKKAFTATNGHKGSGWSYSGWDGTVVATCAEPYPILIGCGYAAQGNTGSRNAVGATSGDRATPGKTSNSCSLQLHHDGKSLGGDGHWINGTVTATCQTRPGVIIKETVSCMNK